MDRNYYGIKALVVTLAISVIALSCVSGFPTRNDTAIRTNYTAAAALQVAVSDAMERFTQAIGKRAKQTLSELHIAAL